MIELKSQASPTNSDFSDTDSTPDTDSGPAPYFTGPTADVTDSDASDTEATPGTLKAFGKEIRTLFKDILDKHFKTPEKEPGQPEVPLPPCVDIFNSFKERPSSSMEQYEKLKYRFDKQCKDLKSKSEDQSRSNEQSKHQSEETPDSKFEHEYQVRQLEFILRFERSAFLRWADENLLFIKRHDDSLDGKVKSVEWASKIERENRRFDKKLYRHMSGLVDESFKGE